jgi:deoxyribodipyrimidine photo-lyase
MTAKAILWFRNDLRLSDNPALAKAVQIGDILPIYIYDDANPVDAEPGSASRVWLHHSLDKLNQSLDGHLALFRGDPIEIIPKIVQKYEISHVNWNRQYEPWAMQRDTTVKKYLKDSGVNVESHNGSLLWEPRDITKADGTPYRVFTPFYRKGCLNAAEPRVPKPAPVITKYVKHQEHSTIESIGLLPETAWHQPMLDHWEIGEKGAQKRLESFIKNGIHHYKEGRNFPSKPYVSYISPHLHFGELSPNQAWHRARSLVADKNIDHFCSELGWREFSYNLLFHNPDLPNTNLQKKFDKFPWSTDADLLKAWQRGRTGVPFVDAGMRQLWATGTMHNRVRMVVGSFLVKNLLLDWRHGERWFWDCLFDADLANNSAGWQWVAGCGADAAPYFRIFNPVTQGQKFDGTGAFIRQYIPEISNLPDKYLCNPWEAPMEVLEAANVKLGVTYPKPVIDLSSSRSMALEAFASTKE